MSLWRVCFISSFVAFFSITTRAQISKGNQILIDRGFQVQGLVSTYDTFHLTTLSNANYTTVHWLWNDPRSYSGSMPWLGAAPGFPWARWVSDETDMPPLGDEASYMNQLVMLQLSDEPNLDDSTVRTRFVNWFNAVHDNWPNTILSLNDGGGLQDGNLIDFVNRGHPDMITFDNYPWKSVYDTNQPDHIGAAIGGPPTIWYSVLRIHRDIARGFNIPFGSYVQTFHAVEEYGPHNVYRDPSPSELRLNHFGALAFNAKTLIDFHYNNGSSSLFTSPGGDSNPNALYFEKADCALRCRNFGKALVRLKPIDEATTQWTTSVLFIRGRNSSGTLNAIPINFYAGPGNGDVNTDWVYQRNDAYLTNWSVTNQGTKNNGQPGDVILAWFKPLAENLEGADFTNGNYLMVVNGLSDPTGTAADCLQEIKLNFANTLFAIDKINPLTGVLEHQTLTPTNGLHQLVLNLNGGDAALFKFSDSAGPPVITSQPANRTNVLGTDATFSVSAVGALPLSYQWRLNGVNINGATTNSFTQTNVQWADDTKNYTVVVSNLEGSVTSAPPAILTVVSALPILYEPFDYPNIGSAVSSNTPSNWTYGGTGTNDFNVTGGSLSYPGLRVSIGNSATNGGVGLGVRRWIGTNVNNGALYFSALFRMNNLGYGTGGWNGAAAQIGGLLASDNSTFEFQIMAKSNSPSGYIIGVQKGGTSGLTPAFDTTEYHANDTLFFVGKYDFSTSPNLATLWINPNSSTFGAASPPATGFISATAGTNGLTIDRFNFRQNQATGSGSVPAAMQWDELRIGTSWADVAQPPRPPRFTSAQFLPDKRIQFQAAGDPGSVTVQVSSNLVQWIDLTNLVSTNGIFDYTQPTTNQPQQFYRLRISQ